MRFFRPKRNSAESGVILATMRMRNNAGILCLLAAVSPATAQEEWEGRSVSEVRAGDGWRRHRFENLRPLLRARTGEPYTRENRSRDERALWDQGLFSDVRIDVRPGLLLVVSVAEYELVAELEIRGHSVYPSAEIQEKLAVRAGRYLNPSQLRQDEEALAEMYVSKGYHFFRSRREETPIEGGVRLRWILTEGPLVSVEAVEFTGNAGVSGSDLKRRIRTRENDVLLFIPTGKNPFLQRNLAEDVKWIQVAYWTEGWLDVAREGRVFVEDVVFNEAKTSVRVRYHIEEGSRYVVRGVRIRGNTVFAEAEIRSWLSVRPGDFYSERKAHEDVRKIREKYGERAYVLAEVDAEKLVSGDRPELELLFDVRENGKVFIGEVGIRGNGKTREEVIRRELTRAGFLPGEEFDRSKLDKAVRRLRSTGWFGSEHDPSRGVSVRWKPGNEPNVQDVEVEVLEDPSREEGRTGNIRFGGGYSSAWGFLGMFEVTQTNFDLADLPTSLSDFLNGTAFAGGGQMLRLRLAPAVHRQAGSLEFREPYLFGWEVGFGLRLYHNETDRESWHERRTGGALLFDKPLDPFRLELALAGYEIGVSNLEGDAPSSVASLDGTHQLRSITPAIVFDTRNHPLSPSEGVRARLSWEYAGQLLGGDFDFNKWIAEAEGYLTLFESPTGLKHVLSARVVFGVADQDPPPFERFYAGGRGSIRGFEYRGIGPRENGDPIGGRALAFGSLEYSFPLFTEILRGAVFWDVANLTEDLSDLTRTQFRNTLGVGIRFTIPILSQIPIAIDFGFPLSKTEEDEEALITLDIGRPF